jgi:hypothetical protein
MIVFNIIVSLVLVASGLKMVTQGNQIGWLLIGCVPVHWILRARRAENSAGSTFSRGSSPNIVRRPVRPVSNPIAPSRIQDKKAIEQEAEQAAPRNR